VWAALQDCQPLAPDLVVTHGDFSLENILLHEGAVAGCIDVGRAGVADRYQDLAIVWRALGALDALLQQRLLRQYGILDIDQDKLQFHLLLDELF
jgi:aminoglycoside 3'-phosphotransferase-1